MKTNSTLKDGTKSRKVFKWRYKLLSKPWTDWVISPADGSGTIPLLPNPESTIHFYVKIEDKQDDYEAELVCNGTSNTGKMKNSGLTSQVLSEDVKSTKVTATLMEVYQFKGEPDVVQFRWRYTSNPGTFPDDWNETPNYGNEPQTIYLDRETHAGLLCFDVVIKDNKFYDAQIKWKNSQEEKQSEPNLVTTGETSRVSLDINGCTYYLEVEVKI